mmetsp:Transcript_23727/g.23623  ORF Transcript_23727/g.23623 Transcript_23727/m.23623 type:complete len:193 (+) Transcript_23727:1-579(+)
MGTRLAKIICITLIVGAVLCRKLDFSNLRNEMKESETFEKFMETYVGKDSGIRFFTYQNVVDLLHNIDSQFTFTRVSSIGKTYEEREMLLLTIGENFQKFEEGDPKDNPPAILLTSAHHAREVVGVTMNLYVVLSLLYNSVHEDRETLALLENHTFYSLPLVNVDGYYLVSKEWEESNLFNYVRKNRRDSGG